MLRNIAVNAVLKIGLIFPLAYSGLAALVIPDKVLTFWPSILVNHLNNSFLIFVSGVAPFILAGWLCLKRKNFTSALTITILMILIGLSNIKNVPFLIELAPLFFIGLALSLQHYPRIRVIGQTKVTPLANITIEDEDMEERIESVVESEIHREHDQHIFIPKQ